MIEAIIYYIANKFLHSGHMPNLLKTAIATRLLKKQQLDSNELCNYQSTYIELVLFVKSDRALYSVHIYRYLVTHRSQLSVTLSVWILSLSQL